MKGCVRQLYSFEKGLSMFYKSSGHGEEERWLAPPRGFELVVLSGSSHVPRGSIYGTIMELGPKRSSLLGF